jgi:hypothetical protein
VNFPVPGLPTVTWLELVWLALAVYGMAMTLQNLRDALGDLRHVDENLQYATKGQIIVAPGLVWQEALVLIALSGCLLLGLVAASLTSRTPESGQMVHWTSYVSPVILITIEAALTALSHHSRRQRTRVKQLVTLNGHRAGEHPG